MTDAQTDLICVEVLSATSSIGMACLILQVPEMKLFEFANCAYPDEVAQLMLSYLIQIYTVYYAVFDY